MRHAKTVYQDYVSEPEQAWVVGSDSEDFAQKVNLAELLQNIASEIGKYSEEGE